ncbi:hypothetical protein NQ317_013033 [Molorchus minor]|uniref:Uncharacterized protein n=1 Tax=Molorchus minor TaxID=1323400 RepID=A0ABQ9K5F0_9CUCU|nr:hypothetical protein NQ317_013033 [Molorchus minor]
MEYLQQKMRYFANIIGSPLKANQINKEREVSRYELYFENIYKVLSWEDVTLTLIVFLVLNFLFWLIFCIIVSLFFFFMWVLGRSVSGYILLYLSLLTIFATSLVFKYLPEEYTIYIKQIVNSVGTSQGILAEEELIPFILNKDFSRTDADLDSLLTDRTADSATNSLVSGISMMPSYLDIVESQEGIKEDDLIPKNIHEAVSYTPGELSSDSDSEHREIHFDSAHFNGDTSSEEENLLAKGMQFSSDTIEPTKAGPALANVLSNFAALGGTLMANVLKSNPVPERKDSSSDSEFEVINTDDIDNA